METETEETEENATNDDKTRIFLLPLHRIEFVTPPKEMYPVDVAWANMKTADLILNLKLFIDASMGWLRCNPKKNYQNLETELRERDFETHLIAKIPSLTGGDLKIPFSTSQKEKIDFECIMSCRPRKYALEELLETAESYEQNWARLAFAGSVYFGTDEPEVTEQAIADGQIIMFSEKEKTTSERLSFNEVLIKIEELTLEDHMVNLEAKFPDLQIIVVSTENDGSSSKLYVCVAGSPATIVSDIGFIIKMTQEGKFIRPVQLDLSQIHVVQEKDIPVPNNGGNNNNV